MEQFLCSNLDSIPKRDALFLTDFFLYKKYKTADFFDDFPIRNMFVFISELISISKKTCKIEHRILCHPVSFEWVTNWVKIYQISYMSSKETKI